MSPHLASDTPQRSLLAIPALSTRFFEKAAQGGADSAFLDLEDSVSPDSKLAARKEAIRALNDIDWGIKKVGVRVNALETPWGLRDIMELAASCRRLNFILLPRVETPFQVQHVDALIDELAQEVGVTLPVALHAIVETPLGLTNVEAIAAAGSRLQALSFGFGDFSIGMGSYANLIDGTGEQWTFAMARIAIACKARGLRAFDGPHTQYGDLAGLLKRAKLASRMGFDGKWIVHPSQIESCHEAFRPSDTHVNWANNVLEALKPALANGTGAIGLNGQLLDMAHIRLAKEILSRAST